MRKLYNKQTLICFFGTIISSLVYHETNNGITLGLAIIFFGGLLQSIYDMHKS